MNRPSVESCLQYSIVAGNFYRLFEFVMAMPTLSV